LLDAQVPQTASVDRKTGGKDKKVTYDGAPQYEKIEGTDLELVKNSDKTVFRTTAPAPSGAGSPGFVLWANPAVRAQAAFRPEKREQVRQYLRYWY
jgi:hypothetical protein